MSQRNAFNQGGHGEHGESPCFAGRCPGVPSVANGSRFALLAVTAVSAVVKQRLSQ